MNVLVIGRNGFGLMPTTPRKARLLIKQGKAKRVCKTPFTIKLLYKTGSATQDTTLGIDTGSQHIGAATVTEDSVLGRAEFALRTTMEKRSLIEKRKEYRNGRRYRKTRYRKPKNRGHAVRKYSETPVKRNKHITHWVKQTTGFTTDRPEGWLPPSMQSKCDMHIQIIGRYKAALPKGTQIRLEVGRFDVARIKDPEIHNELYQQGPMYGYENIKAYVFDRDHYKCKVCKAKAGSKRKDGTTVKLFAHHIDFKANAATDNPDRMASVCDQCHTGDAHKPGGILYEWMTEGKKFKRGYRDMTFMNILRRRLWEVFPEAEFTYGNITQADRNKRGLEKSHANDAVAIAAGNRKIKKTEIEVVYYQQVRSRKRSLHEANPRKGRKEPNYLAKRNEKNTVSVRINGYVFYIHDKVSYNGQTGWISGFTGTSAYIKDAEDNYIQMPGKKYKQVTLSQVRCLSHNHNWLIGALYPIGSA